MSQCHPPKRRGFTYVDLLVAVVVVTMLTTIAMGQLFRGRETNNRVKCASNLKQIGMGMLLYANDNKGRYPRVRAEPGKVIKLNYHTGVNAADPFKDDGPRPNDVTAALFLLVRTVDVRPEVFKCPSSPGPQPATQPVAGAAPPKWDVTKMSNFPTPQDLHYSIAQPYPSDDAIALGYKFNPSVFAVFAAAADKNPGGEARLKLVSNSTQAELRKGNSPNHASEGQNVLFNDGRVEWLATPFAGANHDNIYTAAAVGPRRQQREPAASVPGEQPQLDLDSVLLPTAEDKPTAAEKK